MKKDEFSIFPPFEAFYISSLLFCTRSALSSASTVMDLLAENKDGKFEFPPQPPLDTLQNVVNQGAAISRYFWPSDSKYKKRGNALRTAFGVSEESPLRQRKLRNMVEHFDEYLDDFLKECLAGQFIPDYFGRKPPVDRGPIKFFRAFFTNTGEFEILGQIFQLQPIVDEIGRLHISLVESDQKGSRFPFK